MRGQWVSYDSFNLIELIDEVKTRIEEPFRVDDTIHGALIVGKDYYGLCKELREFLERDDKRQDWVKNSLLKNKEFDVAKIYSEYNCNFGLGQLTSMIKCSNCGFDIYVYPDQSKAVCEHCNTINDLNLNSLL